MAVRTASEPVQLPGEVAGQLTLIDAMPLAHLHRAAADGHRARRGVDDRRRRDVRRPVDGLEAVEDVELPGIGDDRVVAGAAAGHVGRLVAHVDLVVALVAGDDVDAAAGGDRVVARAAEERLRRAAAGQRVVARAA